MFVTTTALEQNMPSNFAAVDQKHWRAVRLSISASWFMFVYSVEHDGEKLTQTHLVAWESTLLEMLNAVPKQDHLAVYLMMNEPPSSSVWLHKPVQRAWISAPTEVVDTGGLVLQLVGDDVLRDGMGGAVGFVEGRKLVFENFS